MPKSKTHAKRRRKLQGEHDKLIRWARKKVAILQMQQTIADSYLKVPEAEDDVPSVR